MFEAAQKKKQKAEASSSRSHPFKLASSSYSSGDNNDSGFYHDVDAPVYGTYRRKTSFHTNLGLGLGGGGARVAPLEQSGFGSAATTLAAHEVVREEDEEEEEVCSCGFVYTAEGEEEDPRSYRHFESPAETLDRRCTVPAGNAFELRQFGKKKNLESNYYGGSQLAKGAHFTPPAASPPLCPSLSLGKKEDQTQFRSRRRRFRRSNYAYYTTPTTLRQRLFSLFETEMLLVW